MDGLRVIIEPDWPSDGFDVYVVQDAGRTRLLLQPGDAIDSGDAGAIQDRAGWHWAPVDPQHARDNHPPSFALTRDVLEALVAAAAGHVDAEAATVAHLKDAVAVRDRLLTMIEIEWAREPVVETVAR